MDMLPESITYFWALSALGGIYIIFKLARFGSREKNLPPGPPTYPIVGNAHLTVDKDLYKRSEPNFSVLRHMVGQPILDSKIGVNSMERCSLSKLGKAR